MKGIELKIATAVRTLGGCLETKPQSGRRYPSVAYNGRTEGVHRAAWMFRHGPIAPGLEVCHTCDNVLCIADEHLFLETHKQNMEDRDRKGRCGTIGENAPLAKLTAPKVVEIHMLARSGVGRFELAARFNISASTVRRIANQTTWKHLFNTLVAA